MHDSLAFINNDEKNYNVNVNGVIEKRTTRNRKGSHAMSVMAMFTMHTTAHQLQQATKHHQQQLCCPRMISFRQRKSMTATKILQLFNMVYYATRLMSAPTKKLDIA